MKKRTRNVKKKKWINRILNILIICVLVSIAVVSYYMFFYESEKEEKESPKPVVQESVEKPVTDDMEDAISPEELQWMREKMKDPNVMETYQQPDWTPIETQQREPHAISYEIGSVDWLEMKQCIAYATNLTFRDFSTWHIGHGEKKNETIGIISTKDGAYHYRIYMEWITNKGWKPKLVQQLRKPEW